MEYFTTSRKLSRMSRGFALRRDGDSIALLRRTERPRVYEVLGRYAPDKPLIGMRGAAQRRIAQHETQNKSL